MNTGVNASITYNRCKAPYDNGDEGFETQAIYNFYNEDSELFRLITEMHTSCE